MNKQVLSEGIDQLPQMLKSTQEWFASIISNSLSEHNTIQSYSPHGMLIAEEAARYITSSIDLEPHERMQIYNQQYWWRLLKTLHINFPLVTRLFGYQAFNEEIGIPYLLKYPPDHWSLNLLGDHLPKWISECYQRPDRSLIENAAHLDRAFTDSFLAPQYAPLNLSHLIQGNPESLLSYTFYLQPHIYLFTLEYDLFSFRQNFLAEEIDYWVDHPFPELLKGKTYHFVLHRNIKNNISWREMSPAGFLLLECFKKGTTIGDACEYLESQETALYGEAVSHLQKWLQDWTHAGWFTLEVPKK